MKKIQSLKDIDYGTAEGKALSAALLIITSECRTDMTFEQVMDEINDLTHIIENAETIDNGPTGHGDICMSDADPGL